MRVKNMRWKGRWSENKSTKSQLSIENSYKSQKESDFWSTDKKRHQLRNGDAGQPQASDDLIKIISIFSFSDQIEVI